MITVTFYKSTMRSKNANGKKTQAFRFRVTGGNNEKLTGSEGYANKGDCESTAYLVTHAGHRKDLSVKYDKSWGKTNE